jgi:hypothetical protein
MGQSASTAIIGRPPAQGLRPLRDTANPTANGWIAPFGNMGLATIVATHTCRPSGKGFAKWRKREVSRGIHLIVNIRRSLMYPIVGIFTSRTDAERTGDHLHALGIPKEHISLLSPCAPEEEMELAPMMDTERPLMGKVLGGLVGFAIGGGGGVLAARTAGIFLPGVGPILAIGTLGAALLALAGTIVGVEVGSMAENALTTGVPKDEMFVYEDALRKGRTVLIALADDHLQVEASHRILEQAGAESIDAARHVWWMGLRSAEQAVYTAQGGDFLGDEPTYRRGFEAALHPETHGKSYEEALAYLREHDGDVCGQECFRRGYERGQAYAEALEKARARS